MRVTPKDLATFAYCPAMYWNKGSVIPGLTEIEEAARLSILSAEKRSMERDSFVAPLKIAGEWDKIWWPKAIANGANLKEIEKTSFAIVGKLNEYCKYDIGSPEYTTVSVDIKSEILTNDNVLVVSADLLKIPTSKRQDEIVIIDFSRKNITSLELSTDVMALATASAFSGFNKPISYIVVDLSESEKNLIISYCNYDKDTLFAAEKMVNYLSSGIAKKINYKSRNCGVCQLCSN